MSNCLLTSLVKSWPLQLQKLGSRCVLIRGAKYSLGTINCRYTNFSPELEKTLQSEINFQSIKELSKYSARHIKWQRRQDQSDLQYFNYLLLDPRVTNKLPIRASRMHCIDIWFTFLRAIFYVGKGKGIRPYVHFMQADKLLGKPDSIKQAKDPKLALILSIWEQKRGVLLMRGFRGISSTDAQTREASMISALSMNHLTNRRLGAYFGPAKDKFTATQRKLLGIALLYKLMGHFISKEEREIHPQIHKLPAAKAA
ncbi:ankyrin repeat and LEM domain-containing protein 1 [Drosophila subobscura]|uniref:ankyrin repeat and LEM domain-containing protein 1 n=1 Tax=Drosophila subobscura TaxID=7241 RepID=UPI00155A43DB|nr:ankyrin repeat and LEM domain-containing protein 1 [Drosophila subobscura]